MRKGILGDMFRGLSQDKLLLPPELPWVQALCGPSEFRRCTPYRGERCGRAPTCNTGRTRKVVREPLPSKSSQRWRVRSPHPTSGMATAPPVPEGHFPLSNMGFQKKAASPQQLGLIGGKKPVGTGTAQTREATFPKPSHHRPVPAGPAPPRAPLQTPPH